LIINQEDQDILNEFTEAVYDMRFEPSLFWDEDFLPYMIQNLKISKQIIITPRFMNHFDFLGIKDYKVLTQLVLYFSI